MPNLNASPVARRRALLFSWATIALLPVLFVATQSAAASRNFPFWDELDSAIDFVLKLSAGGNWRDMADQFFALNNEHRTVTSRIIFAVSYWFSGTVNFHVVGVLGNLFMVGACALLIGAARGVENRIRTGVVLALLIFQLENFENFVWSGASIDHFQVVLLAVASFVLLTRDAARGCGWAAFFAVLATFTLAHGSIVWLLGAVWLTATRHWRRLAIWCGVGAIALVAFFWGFSFNPGHNIPAFGPAAVASVAGFWLQLVGSPLTFGNREFAAIPGVFLVAYLVVLAARGALQRHPVPFLTALFGVLSLGLVAFGRVHMGSETITSRYMILATLPWAMVISVLLAEGSTEKHPFRWLAYVTPGLVVLNVTADVVFQGPKEAFIEVRDRAATHFKSFGHVGEGISRMHPQPRRAEEILAAASARGVYQLARVSNLVDFAAVEPSTRIITYVDELVLNDRAVTVGGWAMIPGQVSKRGQVYLVLQTDDSFQVYSTLTLQRPDVARAYKEPRWRLCGFRAIIGRERLPARNYRVGVLIANGGKAEYLLTDNRVPLGARAEGNLQLATAP